MLRFSSFYPVRSLGVFSRIYPSLVWHKSRDQKEIYLTFDDGPIPEITPWVLDTLKQYDIKATFFCIGKNVVNHPNIYDRILKEGHRIGNHTHTHLNGWNTTISKYINEVSTANEVIRSDLFRPPYGRIKRGQILALKKKYDIIMWDVLSGDFDPHYTPDQCIYNVLKNTRNGSIIVMHDSLKAKANLKESLTIILQSLLESGFDFKTL